MAIHGLGALADLPASGGRAFAIAGRKIAVFQAEGELFAIDDTCSHADASLSAGEFDADELCVECPMHGSLFDLRSGRALTLPAFAPVQTYRVWHENDQVFVEFAD
jgi:3-phenylpropionate/trans-cinnamate dioxygenase ferredoxin subunit